MFLASSNEIFNAHGSGKLFEPETKKNKGESAAGYLTELRKLY